MAIRAILWDLDGTIIDTELLYVQSVLSVNEKYNLTLPLDNLDHGTCLSRCWQEIEKHNSPDIGFEQWRQEVGVTTLEAFNPDILQPYAGEVIAQLHNQGKILICVSNSDSFFIQKALKKTEVFQYFQGLVGRDNVQKGKPDPEIYLKALSDFNLQAHECIVIEDSDIGATAAIKAGLQVIAVPAFKDGHIHVTAKSTPCFDRREILKIIELN